MMAYDPIWKEKGPRIREELVQIAAKVPETLAVSVLEVGMMSSIVYCKDEYFDERRMASFGAAASSCAERVCLDTSLGVWEHTILSCEEGLAFLAVVSKEYTILCLVVRSATSPDELVAALQPHCRTLWELMNG